MANISEPDMTIGLIMYSMTHNMDLYVQFLRLNGDAFAAVSAFHQVKSIPG